MKQRFEKQGFKIPQTAKNGALLLAAFCAWHYLGLTFYNTVSNKGQDALRREGVPEDEINKLSGYRKMMHNTDGEVRRIHINSLFGSKKDEVSQNTSEEL